MTALSIGRNDPCLCGSENKYKNAVSIKQNTNVDFFLGMQTIQR
ncbi:SEC-C metal-binding domain-containing protein [Paenibacillus thermotolerans]